MRASRDPNAIKIEERLKNLGDFLIDAILDDDPNTKFTEFIENPNQIFKSNYKLPKILQHSPPIISVCCFFGSVKCFRSLIDLGADPLINDELDYTTAHFVAFSGNLEIARDLFNLGVDFQQPTQQLFQYMPFLYPSQEFYPQTIAAINLKQDFINWLWLKGCKIDKTLLIYSSAYGNMETIKFLFDTLHFFGEEDDDDENEDIIKRSLNSAAVNGQDKVITFLLQKFPKFDLVEPLIYAARNGSINCVKICYKYQKKEGNIDCWEAFLNACSFGHLDIVLFFAKAGINPSLIGKRITPLECAVSNNHFKVAETLITNGYVKIDNESLLQSIKNKYDQNTQNSLESKISNKTDINIKSSDDTGNQNSIDEDDSSGNKASYSDEDIQNNYIFSKHYFFDENPTMLLEQATANENLDMIKLIQNAFSMNLSGQSNIANIALRNKNLKITDYFIDQGVSIKDLASNNFFLMDKKSKQAIAKDKPICEYFIEKGILETEELPFYLILAGDLQGLTYVLNKGGEISESFLNKNVNQIIKENLAGKNYQMIYFLLDNYNLKVNDKMLFGLEISNQQIYYDIIKRFVDKGITLSTPKNGHSLLYYAIINNNLKAIELLKDNGADFTHVAIPILSFQYSKFFNVLKDIIDSENDFSKCEPKGSGKSFFITQIYYHLQNKELLKFLFEIGFINNINKKYDDDGNTLLDFALYNEDVDTMIFLLSNNASIENCSNDQSAFDEFSKSAKNKCLSDLIDKQIEMYFNLEDD